MYWIEVRTVFNVKATTTTSTLIHQGLIVWNTNKQCYNIVTGKINTFTLYNKSAGTFNYVMYQIVVVVVFLITVCVCVLNCNRLWCGVRRDKLEACRPIGKYSFNKLSQTRIGLFSSLWGQFSFAKEQIPKDPLGFGYRVNQKTKTKPELTFSRTPYFANISLFLTEWMLGKSRCVQIFP